MLFRLDLGKRALERIDLNLDLPGDLVSIHSWEDDHLSYIAGAFCAGSVDDSQVTSSLFVACVKIRESSIIVESSRTRQVEYLPFLIQLIPDVLELNGNDRTLLVSGSDGGLHLLSCSTLNDPSECAFPAELFLQGSITIMSLDCLCGKDRVIIAAGSNDGNVVICEGVASSGKFQWSSLGSFLLDGPFPAVQLNRVNDVVSLVAVAALGGVFMFHDIHNGLDASKESLSFLSESDTSDCLTSACFDILGRFILIGSWIQEVLVYECHHSPGSAPRFIGRLQFSDPVYSIAWDTSVTHHLLIFTMKEVLVFSRDDIISFIESQKHMLEENSVGILSL